MSHTSSVRNLVSGSSGRTDLRGSWNNATKSIQVTLEQADILGTQQATPSPFKHADWCADSHLVMPIPGQSNLTRDYCLCYHFRMQFNLTNSIHFHLISESTRTQLNLTLGSLQTPRQDGRVEWFFTRTRSRASHNLDCRLRAFGSDCLRCGCPSRKLHGVFEALHWLLHCLGVGLCQCGGMGLVITS